jgi:hypothetical protein
MTQWGLDTLFNPAKRHMDEEKRRLQSTREEIGDNSGGNRIDLDSGKVVIRRDSAADGTAADGTAADGAEAGGAEAGGAEAGDEAASEVRAEDQDDEAARSAAVPGESDAARRARERFAKARAARQR